MIGIGVGVDNQGEGPFLFVKNLADLSPRFLIISAVDKDYPATGAPVSGSIQADIHW